MQGIKLVWPYTVKIAYYAFMPWSMYMQFSRILPIELKSGYAPYIAKRITQIMLHSYKPLCSINSTFPFSYSKIMSTNILSSSPIA